MKAKQNRNYNWKKKYYVYAECADCGRASVKWAVTTQERTSAEQGSSDLCGYFLDEVLSNFHKKTPYQRRVAFNVLKAAWLD